MGILMVASQGLEPQQAESESAVLPLHHEAIALLFRLAGSTGLEPATPGSTVQCANQLRHNPVAPKLSFFRRYAIAARAAARSANSPPAIIWTIRLPMAVPSTGPAKTSSPVASAVSAFRYLS